MQTCGWTRVQRPAFRSTVTSVYLHTEPESQKSMQSRQATLWVGFHVSPEKVLTKFQLSAALSRPMVSLPLPFDGLSVPDEENKVSQSEMELVFLSSDFVCLISNFCSGCVWRRAFFLTYLQLL